MALTRTEFDLLAALAEHPGHVLSRVQLAGQIFGGAYDECDRTIDSHVKRLRRKFKAADVDSQEIETLYGVGYRYRVQ